MNLYLLKQSENRDYDTWDSCVVAAPSEEDAKRIHPYHAQKLWTEETPWTASGWASEPSKVEVQLIGQALDGTPMGVILGSYNAG